MRYVKSLVAFTVWYHDKLIAICLKRNFIQILSMISVINYGILVVNRWLCIFTSRRSRFYNPILNNCYHHGWNARYYHYVDTEAMLTMNQLRNLHCKTMLYIRGDKVITIQDIIHWLILIIEYKLCRHQRCKASLVTAYMYFLLHLSLFQ